MKHYHLYYLPQTEDWCQAWLVHTEEDLISIVETDNQGDVKITDLANQVEDVFRKHEETVGKDYTNSILSFLGVDIDPNIARRDDLIHEVPELHQVSLTLEEVVNYINTYHLIS